MNPTTREQIEIRQDIIHRIKKDLIERLSLPYSEEDMHEDAALLGSGFGLDSLDALEVILGIEQEFNVKVDDKDVGILRSINSIVDYLLDRGVGSSVKERRT